MQASSPFFSLPSEVRDRIYDFYLTYDHGDFGDSLQPHQLYLDGAVYSQPLPALMRTCKRIYEEMSPIVHGQAAMRIEIRGRVDRRIGFAVHGTLRFDRLRKLWLLIPLEYPNWNQWLYFFGDVVRHTPNLKVLILDWTPRPVPEHGWSGRVNAKKEAEFFEIIESLKELHTFVIYGDVSARWIDRLKGSELRIVRHRSRWWREPGDP
ncbi:hypothetical protein FHL15_008405 [Xylaria flabelliformis]|uniref:Uncharacterized protein n=1 Tax=Xylaria flabelliformis TaxID=2512241 RepID=A0A553HRR3_9PEZI|nr:hypothetical protein FHL15_008405 [Xylaria flabelliformis]